jgi:hypothetical protein
MAAKSGGAAVVTGQRDEPGYRAQQAGGWAARSATRRLIDRKKLIVDDE